MGGAGYSCALVTTAGAQRPSSAAPARPGPWPGFWPALLAIVAAGVAIRVVYTLAEAPWPPPGLDDEFYFSALPKLLADGHGFIAPFKFVFDHVSVATAEHPPLYSVLLAGPALLGLDSPDSQRLAGSLFGAVTIVALGLLGRRLAGDRAGLLAAGLGAVYPSLIAADGALMSETLYGALIALSLLAAYRLLDAPSAGRAVVLGAVSALAALTRGEALLLLPLVLIPVVWRAAWRRVAPGGGRPGRLRGGARALDRAQLDRLRPAGRDRHELGHGGGRSQLRRDLRQRGPAGRLVPALHQGAPGQERGGAPRGGAARRRELRAATTPGGCRSCWPRASGACGASTSRSRSPRAARCACRSWAW